MNVLSSFTLPSCDSNDVSYTMLGCVVVSANNLNGLSVHVVATPPNSSVPAGGKPLNSKHWPSYKSVVANGSSVKALNPSPDITTAKSVPSKVDAFVKLNCNMFPCELVLVNRDPWVAIL